MEILLWLMLMLSGNTQEVETPLKMQVNAAIEQIKMDMNLIEPQPVASLDQGAGTEEWVKRDPQHDTAPTIRGVYASAHTANGARMETLLDLIDSTELNAVVVDVKEDFGYVTYDTGNPEIESFETTQPIIQDMEGFMQRLQEHDVYPIARIVVFKDSILAKKRPELSFLNPDGSVWANNKSNPESFVNPYRKEIWDYNIEVAKEAVKAGFKEIQFDYVRFPEGFEQRADILVYDQDERSRVDVVAEFVDYARQELNPLGARVSVDIFGYASSVPAAEGIGQDFNKISKYVDVISPMVYPSHYSTGWFGSTVPDANPYTTIYGSMVDTHKKMEELVELKPIIRPWIQDFTATWVKGYIPYGKKEVEEQIRALRDTGVEEFLLWNSGNRYTESVDYTLESYD